MNKLRVKTLAMSLVVAMVCVAVLPMAGTAQAADVVIPIPPPPPPSAPYPRTEFAADGVGVQDWSPRPGSQIILEPSFSHGDVYQAHGTWLAPHPWPGCVVGRADTEALRMPGVTTTKVWVSVTLWRWNADLQRWEHQATTTRSTTTPQWCSLTRRWEYDIDAYAGGPWLGPALYAVNAWLRVYRDGVLTASGRHLTREWVQTRFWLTS